MIPMKAVVALGEAMDFLGHTLVVDVDMDAVVQNRAVKTRYGFEYWPWQEKNWSMAFRVGKNDWDRLSAGVGLRVYTLSLDYAWEDHDLGASQLVGLGVTL
jgi:hypothetical protein